MLVTFHTFSGLFFISLFASLLNVCVELFTHSWLSFLHSQWLFIYFFTNYIISVHDLKLNLWWVFITSPTTKPNCSIPNWSHNLNVPKNKIHHYNGILIHLRTYNKYFTRTMLLYCALSHNSFVLYLTSPLTKTHGFHMLIPEWVELVYMFLHHRKYKGMSTKVTHCFSPLGIHIFWANPLYSLSIKIHIIV